MSQTPERPAGSKKPYEPPQVILVSLRPEEAVLGNCKFMGVAGPANVSCTTIPVCFSPGS
jgi:hypothetical protein